MTIRIRVGMLGSLAALCIAACTTTGTGSGTVREGLTPVTFDWTSTDNVSGTLTAKLADGQSFTGEYFQITQDIRTDRLSPLWDGWYRPWGGWPYWGANAGPQFGQYYSGRVLANLHAPNGGHLRCRFRLIHPSNGLAGGAQGTCQLPDGKNMDVTLGSRP